MPLYLFSLLLVVLLPYLAKAGEGDPSLYTNTRCGAYLEYDRAELAFTGYEQFGLLYVVNSDCFECAPQLVFNTSSPLYQSPRSGGGSGSSYYYTDDIGGNSADTSSRTSCAILWTPFPWTFSLVSFSSGETVSTLDFTFGEHGTYNMSANAQGELLISQLGASDDPNQALSIWIGILISIVFASFVVPYLFESYKRGTFFVAKSDETSSSSAVRGSLRQGLLNDDERDRRLPPTSDAEGDTKTIRFTLQTQEEEEAAAAGGGRDAGNQEPKSTRKAKPPRLESLDTFRGFCLGMMIFVNYGGGGYWFFEHAAWNGLTFADLLFPWFMWVMGCSMALSMSSVHDAPSGDEADLWYKMARRTVILFGIGLFLANGRLVVTTGRWRISGVLQYFAISYFFVSSSVLLARKWTHDALRSIRALERRVSQDNAASTMLLHPADRSTFWFFCSPPPSRIMLAYRYEWLLQAIILIVYLVVALGGQAPGCPRGYNGPGGISQQGKFEGCTGGIHKYIDDLILGYNHQYHEPTCISLYQCPPYDPEGLLGSLTACTLTYLGLMSGRVLLHFKTHTERLTRWAIWGFVLLLIGGALCGFTRDTGAIPINKNLWSTSFGLVMAGGGLVGLSFTYVLVDMYHLWSGAPFRYLGLNSILIYCCHGIFADYFPFSYALASDDVSHWTLLTMNVVGVASWMLVAYYCYTIKFFVKI